MTKTIWYTIYACLFCLLTIRFFLFYSHQETYKNNQTIDITTTLLSEPKITGGRQSISINTPEGQKIFATVPLYPQYHYGDTLRIVGGLQIKMLNRNNTIMSTYFPKVTLIKNTHFGLAVISSIRQNVIKLFHKTLSERESGLLLGIVFGIKENMDKPFTNNLRTVGVMHVIAASGMNVTMVASFLCSIFLVFFKRQYGLILSMIGILFYAVLSGLEPSILRATIMGIFAFGAQILGRQYSGAYALVLTAFVMLLISPFLIFDVGFQLSFLSTMGLLYISPFLRSKSFVNQDVATTLSAQAATLPILLSNFGSYSIVSVLVNALVLWTIPPLMIIGGIGSLLGFIIEPIGQLFLYASLPLLIYFEIIVEFFGKIQGFSVTSLPLTISIGYYLLLASLLLMGRKR